MEKDELNEVVSMLSTLAEAVLFDWPNVADVAREAAIMAKQYQED